MNGNAKFTLMAIGVGAAAFVGCAAVAGLGPHLGTLFRPAPEKMAIMTLSPLTTTVEGTFHRVKPGEIKPEEAEKQQHDNDINMARVAVSMYHLDTTDDVVAAAYDDSPHAKGYAAYAEVARSLVYTDLDRENGVLRDLKLGCFAIRDPSGDTKKTVHLVVKYDASHFVGGSFDGMVDLAEWVTSGCAQAVHDGNRTLSSAQLVTTISDLMPKTPEFDDARRGLRQQLLSRPAPADAGA